MFREAGQVVVVKGLQQPLALRPLTPTGEQLQLVGACDVHGTVRGELWGSREAGRWQGLIVV